MHELSVARNVVDLIREAIPVADLNSVRSVKIKIGDLAGIVPESLAFSYQVLTDRTPLAKSRLLFEHIPFAVRCSQCHLTSASPEGATVCPRCFSTTTTIASGTELELVTIELEEGDLKDSHGHRNR